MIAAAPPRARPALKLAVSRRDHSRGPAGAPVTLVEYGDYECPNCGRAYPILEMLEERIGDLYRFVYRHFPLTQNHPHAEAAAEAAEAANTEGRFWEMHDMLFQHQDALDAPNLIRYGEAIGIDSSWLLQALASREFQPRVREDFMSGVRSGVNATPSFFIDGYRYDGPVELDSLALAIEDAAENIIR